MTSRRSRARFRLPELTRGTVRARAAAVAEYIVEGKQPAESPLKTGARGLSEVDRGLLRELVLGAVRWLRRIDWVITAIAGRPLERIDHRIRWPLRIGVYQLLFLDRIPAYAVVNEAVEEVRRRSAGRATGFANAVLRRLASRRSLADWEPSGMDTLERVAIETSHPDFLIARWRDRLGWNATRLLLAANNARRPMHLLCLGDREAIADKLAGEGVETSADVLSPYGLRVVSGDAVRTSVFSRGEVYVQDDASQAAALVPPPRVGERILDLAAAPGGKGFTLRAAEPSATITASDVSLPRLLTLRANLQRLGARSSLAVVDGRRPAFASSFDRVVLDLPCSGTGTIARHPELKWRLSMEEIERLALQGGALLEQAASLVAPGGLACVITCSLEAEENEMLIERFLARETGFERAPLARLLSPPLASGILGDGMWRLLPTGEHDGFTVHVLQRTMDH